MAKKVTLKTSKNDNSVDNYLASLTPDTRREQGLRLNALFQDATGFAPKMWGGSIIGYGQYTYCRANGDEGEMAATGFAMRKSGPVLYVISGYEKMGELLAQIGPHKLGKSCLYIKRLSDVDLAIVSELISKGLDDLKTRYTVQSI